MWIRVPCGIGHEFFPLTDRGRGRRQDMADEAARHFAVLPCRLAENCRLLRSWTLRNGLRRRRELLADRLERRQFLEWRRRQGHYQRLAVVGEQHQCCRVRGRASRRRSPAGEAAAVVIELRDRPAAGDGDSELREAGGRCRLDRHLRLVWLTVFKLGILAAAAHRPITDALRSRPAAEMPVRDRNLVKYIKLTTTYGILLSGKTGPSHYTDTNTLITIILKYISNTL